MAALRPDACALVDAWDFPDRVLNSTIGRYDGNVYEAQYQAAAESPVSRPRSSISSSRLAAYCSSHVVLSPS